MLHRCMWGNFGEKPCKSLWRRQHLSNLDYFREIMREEDGRQWENSTGQVAVRELCTGGLPAKSLWVLSKEACYWRTRREKQEQLLRILSSLELVVRRHYCQHRRGQEVENPLNPWSPFCIIYPNIARTRKRNRLIFWGRLPQTIAYEEGKCIEER